MIGEFVLCASIALVVMIPAWADNPDEVARDCKKRQKSKTGHHAIVRSYKAQ